MPGQAAVSAAPKFTLIAMTNAMLQLDAPATEARFVRLECLTKFVDALPANALTELQPDGRTYKKKDPAYGELAWAAPQAAWRHALVHWAALWYQRCFDSSGALALDRTIDARFDDSMKQSPQSLSLKDGLEAVFDLPEGLGEDELQASRIRYADAKKLLNAAGVREIDLTKNNFKAGLDAIKRGRTWTKSLELRTPANVWFLRGATFKDQAWAERVLTRGN
jgi:hypothetical protein